MILTISDDFDPGKIADSGQCFRWEKVEPRTYRIISAAECVYLTALGNDRYELECSEKAFMPLPACLSLSGCVSRSVRCSMRMTWKKHIGKK